jgi:hypothetical protein
MCAPTLIGTIKLSQKHVKDKYSCLFHQSQQRKKFLNIDIKYHLSFNTLLQFLQLTDHDCSTHYMEL